MSPDLTGDIAQMFTSVLCVYCAAGSHLVDLLPTLLELSGCPVPEVMMGWSYTHELRGGRPLSTREDVMTYQEPGFVTLCTDVYEYIRYGPDCEVLYKCDGYPST